MSLTNNYESYSKSKFYQSYNPEESFEVPIVFLLNSEYQKHLTPLSMLLYGVLKHHFPKYLKMGWVDADGHGGKGGCYLGQH